MTPGQDGFQLPGPDGGLGGGVAATGFMVTGSSHTIPLVAASIIAPGFEPLAKVPISLVLRQWVEASRPWA